MRISFQVHQLEATSFITTPYLNGYHIRSRIKGSFRTHSFYAPYHFKYHIMGHSTLLVVTINDETTIIAAGRKPLSLVEFYKKQSWRNQFRIDCRIFYYWLTGK